MSGRLRYANRKVLEGRYIEGSGYHEYYRLVPVLQVEVTILGEGEPRTEWQDVPLEAE